MRKCLRRVPKYESEPIPQSQLLLDPNSPSTHHPHTPPTPCSNNGAHIRTSLGSAKSARRAASSACLGSRLRSSRTLREFLTDEAEALSFGRLSPAACFCFSASSAATASANSTPSALKHVNGPTHEKGDKPPTK